MVLRGIYNSRCLGRLCHQGQPFKGMQLDHVKMSDPTDRAHRRIRLDEFGRSCPWR